MIFAAAFAPSARAQSVIQQLVSPGLLVAKHAKFENKCESCHASFDKAAQSRLCMDCHKEVAADLAGHRGYHGRLLPANQLCSSCHTDHEGRNKDIVRFNPRDFDHRQTDYVLRDKHVGLTCASCHATGHPYREASSDCVSCHRKEDRHRAQLGQQCQNCHDETGWKNFHFDHAKTNFQLAGAHERAKCETCHADERFKDIATTCVGCHKQDDPHRAQLGVKCESCHNDSNWKQIRFDHAKTKFALLGAHSKSTCMECHADQHYQNVPTSCVSCHGKDDVHKARLGQNCASCHTANNWQVGKFDHGKTKFALLGKHAQTKCEACHLEAAAKVRLAVACDACHRKEDTHKGTFGVNCEQCHSADDWKGGKFDHTKSTRFVLLGKHQTAKCADCHAAGAATAKIAATCISCHEKEDVHAKQLSANCQQCHNDRGWKVAVVFDHELTRFPLLGAHGKAECEDCHTSKRYKEAKTLCIDCHRDDDKHKATLGARCGDCHNAIAWADWSFDHNKQTKFVLVGAHENVTCANCHKPSQAKVSEDCADCHRADDVHGGRFGNDCGRCHTAVSFRALRNRF